MAWQDLSRIILIELFEVEKQAAGLGEWEESISGSEFGRENLPGDAFGINKIIRNRVKLPDEVKSLHSARLLPPHRLR